jgi:hypothetical protein
MPRPTLRARLRGTFCEARLTLTLHLSSGMRILALFNARETALTSTSFNL